jgi:hypothetical protein
MSPNAVRLAGKREGLNVRPGTVAMVQEKKPGRCTWPSVPSAVKRPKSLLNPGAIDRYIAGSATPGIRAKHLDNDLEKVLIVLEPYSTFIGLNQDLDMYPGKLNRRWKRCLILTVPALVERDP